MRISDKFSTDPDPAPLLAIARPIAFKVAVATHKTGALVQRVLVGSFQVFCLGIAMMLLPAAGLFAAFFSAADTGWRVRIGRQSDDKALARTLNPSRN